MKVYHPQIKVTLIKTFTRESTNYDANGKALNSVKPRYKATTIDLTPFLGEGGGVRTSKSVREPAGGFSLTLADKPWADPSNPKSVESLYAMIEPMDLVEIRFCHDSTSMIGKKPPIVMRGLVSEIHRDQSMGQDGRPSRKVVVTGQDFGKVWQIMIIYYLQLVVAGDNTLTFMKWFEKYLGTDKLTTELAGTFLADVVTNALNPFLTGINGTTTDSKDSAVLRGVLAYSSIDGSISPFSMNAFSDVSLYQMLTTLLDVGAFNELFIEDNETEISLILRPIPFTDTSGKLIVDAPAPVCVNSKSNDPRVWTGGTDSPIVIPSEDVQSIESTRTDKGAANWYWTANTKLVLVDDVVMMLMAQQTAGTMDMRTYPNSAESRFGFRKMHVEYKLGANSEVPDSNTGTNNAINSNTATPIEWARARRSLLADLNQDNIVFESGTIRVRGNEQIRAGRFVKLQQGGANVSQFYVVSVDHDYVPFQGFFTSINYERGTGFIDRATQQKPYFKELNVGGIR